MFEVYEFLRDFNWKSVLDNFEKKITFIFIQENTSNNAN